MTIPRGPSLSEPASFQDIEDEFDTPVPAHPIALNEYYAGGTYVGNPASTSIYQIGGIIPTSGAIGVGNFLGVANQFVFNDVISVNFTTGYNLWSRAVAAGWNGIVPLFATVTVNAGVVVTAPTSGLYGFSTAPSGSWPVGSQLTLTNNGYIIGAGGAGAAGGSVSGASLTNGAAGATAGPAMFFSGFLTTYFTNNGVVGGGGGGGGGGGATRNDPTGKLTTFYGASGGGGGGGTGLPAGTGGAAGSSTGNTTDLTGSAGSNSTNGPPPSSGSGGAGALIAAVIRSGDGGAGGTMGMPGFAGFNGDLGFVNGGFSSPGAGGARGVAIVGATVPQWNNYGGIRGAFDGFGFWTAGGVNFSGLFGTHHNTPVVNTYLNGSWTALLGPIWYTHSQQSGLTNIAAANYTFYTFFTNNVASFSGHLYGAVDNSLVSVEVNGSPIVTGTAMGFATTYQTNSFTVPVGISVIKVVLNNPSSSPFGFNLRLRNSSFVDMTHPAMWWV